ncbi:MAG: carbohydrate ABC transporter permease [Clostridia bacterium]|nr:carbohydrate ABC transporter permease [Clostridia bacterium]
MKRKSIWIRTVNTLWVTAIGILFLMPLLWMVSSSLKTGPEVFAANFRWIPDKVQWINFAQVWTHERVPFWRLYGNSLFIAVVSTVGELIVASMAGYSLGKIEFKGRNLVFIVMLVTMMIPAQATIVPRFVIFKSMGLYNNIWALIFPAWFNVTSIFLLRTFYMSLPGDLMEAAKIDGASYFQIWLRIMMPLTKPAMVTAAVLAFINSWNEYLSALVFLPTAENYTVSQGIQYWMSMSDDHNLMMTAAASAILPVIVLFLFTQRYFVESIATTGVKG